MPIVANKTGVPDKHFYVSGAVAENYWVEQSRVDPAAFITYLTGGKRPPAIHHKLWLYYFLDNSYKFINLIAPRESGKSTIVEYALAWFIGNNPWETNQIVCDTFVKAAKRLSNIRSIMGLERYKQVFPWIEIDNRRGEHDRRANNRSEFSVWSSRYKDTYGLSYANWKSILHSYHETRDPTLSASGITAGGSVGARVSGFLVPDDIMTLENSQTLEQRDKVTDAWNAKFDPSVTDGGRVWSISTRWHLDDQCNRWSELADEETGQKLWKTINVPCWRQDGESYWPEQWPVKRLKRKRSTISRYWFGIMFENNPKAGASSLFTEENLLPLPSPLPTFKDLVIVTDLASSLSKKADFTVALLVARDFAYPFNYYVLDMIRGKWGLEGSFQEIVEFRQRMIQTYGPIKYVAIEKQGMQTSAAQRLRALDPTIEVLPVSLHMKDKGERAKPLAIKAQGGYYFVNKRMKYYPIFSAEHINFGAEKHDDCLDAADLLLQLPDWNASSEIRASFSMMKMRKQKKTA